MSTNMTHGAVIQHFDRLVTYLQAQPPIARDPLSAEARSARPAAVLLPLYAGPGGVPHLLFTERASTLRRHSGEISFPGGRRDPADPTSAATALREAQEEIGLDPARVTLLGELNPVFTVVSDYLISPHLGVVSGSIAQIAPTVNAAEVAAVIEAPLPTLADPAIAHTEVWQRHGQAHTVYFYQLGEVRIWGATARILAEFLAYLPH